MDSPNDKEPSEVIRTQKESLQFQISDLKSQISSVILCFHFKFEISNLKFTGGDS